MTADRAALVKFGFDTGDYMCLCADCGLRFQGAKRSWRCRPCADEAVRGRAHTDDSANAPRAALVERVRDIIAGSDNCDRWCEGSVNPHCGCRDDANEAIKIIRAEVLEEAAGVAEQQEEERIGVPCPDGIKGCAVFHFRRRMRPRNHLEIAAAIRALKEKKG